MSTPEYPPAIQEITIPDLLLGIEGRLKLLADTIEGAESMAALSGQDPPDLAFSRQRLLQISDTAAALGGQPHRSRLYRQMPSKPSVADPLFERFVQLDEVPEVSVPADQDALPVIIVRDTQLYTGGQNISFQPLGLCVMNTLLLARDEPRSATELMEMGYHHREATSAESARTLFKYHIRRITSLGKTANRAPLVLNTMRGRQGCHQLNPAVVLSDQRSA